VVFIYDKINKLFEKEKPYDIVRKTTNDIENINIRFKKHTSLSISGDVELIIDGDVFFVNNGRFCILSKESIHLDTKKLFLQCRDNPLLKRHKDIRRELEKNDAILIELQKEELKGK
jgi:RNase adaptor protein for sRNA GlmZ degradation